MTLKFTVGEDIKAGTVVEVDPDTGMLRVAPEPTIRDHARDAARAMNLDMPIDPVADAVSDVWERELKRVRNDLVQLRAVFRRRWYCYVTRTGLHNGAGCSENDRHSDDCLWVWDATLADTNANRRLLGGPPMKES